MAHGIVVLVGGLRIERLALDGLVMEFGFSFKQVESLWDLRNLNLDHDLVAVLFSPANLGLRSDEALRSVLDAAPRALPILCHGFADHIDLPKLADAGAFHSLLMPFNLAEVRQSLGFVWGTKHRSEQKRATTAAGERVLPSRVMAAEIVA